MGWTELLVVKNVSDVPIRIDRVGGEGAVLRRVGKSIDGLQEIEDGGYVTIMPGEFERYAVRSPGDPQFGIARELHDAVVDSDHVRAHFRPEPATRPTTR